MPPNKALVVKFADRAQGPKAPPLSLPLAALGPTSLSLELARQALSELRPEPVVAPPVLLPQPRLALLPELSEALTRAPGLAVSPALEQHPRTGRLPGRAPQLAPWGCIPCSPGGACVEGQPQL